MDHVCVVFPVLPGKTEHAKAFMRELDGPRAAEYDRSERAIGISKRDMVFGHVAKRRRSRWLHGG
jgi:hypothetical protein